MVLAYDIEWLVTDADAVPIGVITGGGGVITWDGRGRVQRVCRGTMFEPASWNDFNPLTDWLMPMFRTADGARVSLGHFTVAGLPQRFVSTSVTVPPEPYLVDGGLLLESASPYNLSGRAGEQVGQVLARVCDAAGIGRRNIAPAGDLLSEPVAYPVGTSFGDALRGFADLAGFLPPHFDRDGVLVLRAPDSGNVAPTVEYDGSSVVAESRVEDSDLFTAPNVWIVVGAGATNAPVTVVREVSPDAPNSVSRRGGRRVAKVIREQGIGSVLQAERVASAAAELSRQSFRTIEFSSAATAGHDCYTVVGVYGEPMFEVAWTLPLAIGDPMLHTVVSRLELTA